jgi:hypothetical protein
MCAAGMSEERLREIVREEILAARLAEEDHEHPELARSQHEHYDMAPLGHEHDLPTTTMGSTPTLTTSTTSRSGADRGGRQLDH